jgi:hypothetical protein
MFARLFQCTDPLTGTCSMEVEVYEGNRRSRLRLYCCTVSPIPLGDE